MSYANEKLTDSTSSYQPPNFRCELCRHYTMIDSGYGYCKRFPPTVIWRWIFKKVIDMVSPVVAWDEKSCGEFNK